MTPGTIDLKIMGERLEIARRALGDLVTPEELFSILHDHLSDLGDLTDTLRDAAKRLASA
jgi:hypothetical protein